MERKRKIAELIENNTCFAIREVGDEPITPNKIQEIFVYTKIKDPCSICKQGDRLFSLFSFLYEKENLGYGYVNIWGGCDCFESGGPVGLYKEGESIKDIAR